MQDKWALEEHLSTAENNQLWDDSGEAARNGKQYMTTSSRICSTWTSGCFHATTRRRSSGTTPAASSRISSEGQEAPPSVWDKE